MYDVLCNCG